MEIDVGSLRCVAPALGIPPNRHYDPSDAEDAALRLEWAKVLFRAGYRLRFPQVSKSIADTKDMPNTVAVGSGGTRLSEAGAADR
ncbi:unnamed protein product [Ectocarpus sp. 8 AP-2014]